MYKYKNINKKKGQAVIESVLLMMLLFAMVMFVLKIGMKDNEWMKTIVGTPGKYIRGMSIAGVWEECETPPVPPSSGGGGCSAMREHPNQKHNTLQVEGNEADQ